MSARLRASAARRRSLPALLWLVAACGGSEAPASPSAASPAPGSPAEARDETPPSELAPAWTPPSGFRVLVPKAPGDASGGMPRVLQHRASGIELVLVPPGAFELGSIDADPGHDADESPARRVEVPAFYLARTETTLAQWRSAPGDGRDGGDGGELVARGRGEGDAHPVAELSWDHASAWCDANGLQLPTEVQWEYAASGPDDRIYPWGDEANAHVANALGTNAGDRWDLTAPVGSLPAGRSWCGALDMAGNVAEWCRDPWRPDYASEPDDAKRVIRGGSYACRPPWCLRTAYRDGIERELMSPNLGFRVVLEVR